MFQQRELRGLSVLVRAVAALLLLRVFSLRVLALVSPLFHVSFLQPETYSVQVLWSIGRVFLELPGLTANC